MRVLRGSLLLAAAAVVTLTAYTFIVFCSVLYVGANDNGAKADVIVVMGAAQYDGRPSPQLAARLDHALLIFNEGRAPLIAVTGGKRLGDRFTEAEASRRYLVARGVAEAAILAETSGASTWQSVANLSPVLQRAGVRSVLVVTDRYHVQRTVLSVREAGYHAAGSATRTSPVVGIRALSHAIEEAIGVAAGRLIGFQRLWRITG
jgi:uncharacterized SAM-binding protein YcdF (DUF218 family)